MKPSSKAAALGPLPFAAALLIMFGSGCGNDVDPAALPTIAGYETWPNFPVIAPAPGHGDTFRVLYANEVARAYPHTGRYAVGTVLVKEIYEKTGNGGRGELVYRAIMRKLGADATGLPVENGWLYTDLRDGKESHKSSCVGCHSQAPFDGAFFDYGQ